MRRRRGLLALAAFVFVPPLLSLAGSEERGFIAPAAACTGPPRFEPSSVVVLPQDGAVVPRNAHVWFLWNVNASVSFGTRPLAPARVQHASGRPRAGQEIPVRKATRQGLELPLLEAGEQIEILLPAGLGAPWDEAGATLARVATFRTTDREDHAPPKLRVTGAPVFLGPGSSCGPPPRIELPVAIDDESPSFVVIRPHAEGVMGDGPTPPNFAPVINGLVTWSDARQTQNRYATHVTLTPVDIAGNRGAAVELDLRRLEDGGVASASVDPAPEPFSFGCGKSPARR